MKKFYLIVRLTPYCKDTDSDRNPTLIVTGRFWHEILRDSIRFHENPREILPQSSQDDLNNKDDPDNKDDPNNKILSQFLPYLSVKWLHRRWVCWWRSSLISQKTGSNGYGNYEPSRISEFGPTLTQTRQHLNEVSYKNQPIQKSLISMRMQPYMHSSWRISRKRTRIADDTMTRT